MAAPIKETPILYGKNSDRFLKDVKANESKRVTARGRIKSTELYNNVMRKATFK
jgi:hypothetical protein